MINKYFEDSCPIEIIFEEDKVYENFLGSKWILSDLSVKFIDNKLYIKSPVLYTDNDTIPKFSGMKYIKVLTPQMVKELKSLFF